MHRVDWPTVAVVNSDVASRLTAIHLREVDHCILNNEKLPAIKIAHRGSGCTFREAVEYVAARHDQLRATRPDDFAATNASTWEGFPESHLRTRARPPSSPTEGIPEVHAARTPPT
jgi:hypothetical protein